MGLFFTRTTSPTVPQGENTVPTEENPLSQYKVSGEVILLPIEQIAPNPNQPRKHYDKQGIEELAQSIAQNGLLQPIVVRRSEDSTSERPFELVAGHRRLLAVSCLGEEHIRAIVDEMDSRGSALMAMVENLQRKDLSFFEEAQALHELTQRWGMSQQQVAQKLGKSQPTVANKIRLLRLPEKVKTIITQNKLSERHARALLRLNSEKDMCLAAMLIVRRELNVQQTEAYIENLLRPPVQEQKKLVILKDYRLFLNSVKKAVDTMASAGIEVNAQKTEDDLFIHYNITIPKSKVLKVGG